MSEAPPPSKDPRPDWALRRDEMSARREGRDKEAARGRAKDAAARRERDRAWQESRRAHALALSVSSYARAGELEKLRSALGSQAAARERKPAKVPICDPEALGMALRGAARCPDADAALAGLRALWAAGARLAPSSLRECFHYSVESGGARGVALWLSEAGFDWKAHGAGLPASALGMGQFDAARIAVGAGASLDPDAELIAAQTRMACEDAPRMRDWLLARGFDWAGRGAGLPARALDKGHGELAREMVALGAPMGEPPGGWSGAQAREEALSTDHKAALEGFVSTRAPSAPGKRARL